jgi:phosphoribosylformylglycinamidine synthase
VGTKRGYDAPPLELAGEGALVLVGDRALAGGEARLGGSELLARVGGSDRYPGLPENPAALVETVASVADWESTLATHDASHGGLAVALAEMVHGDGGAEVALRTERPLATLFHEQPGRVVVETTEPDRVVGAFAGVAPATTVGAADGTGRLSLTVGAETHELDAETVAAWRRTIADALE